MKLGADEDLALLASIHIGDLSEEGAGWVHVRSVEHGVVKRVDGFGAQLQLPSLMQLDVLKERQIEIIEAVAAHVIQAGREDADIISGLLGRGALKTGIDVEPLVR